MPSQSPNSQHRVHNPPGLEILHASSGSSKLFTRHRKGEIIVLNKNNSHTKISEELHIPQQIISTFFKILKIDIHHTIFSTDQWLVRTALTETQLSFKKLKSIANIPVCEQNYSMEIKKFESDNGIN